MTISSELSFQFLNPKKMLDETPRTALIAFFEVSHYLSKSEAFSEEDLDDIDKYYSGFEDKDLKDLILQAFKKEVKNYNKDEALRRFTKEYMEQMFNIIMSCLLDGQMAGM